MALKDTLYGTELALRERSDAADAWNERDVAVARAALLSMSRAVDRWCRVPVGTFAPTAAGVVRYVTAEWADVLRVPAIRTITELATDENGTGSYGRTWASTDYILGPEGADEAGEPWTRITRDDRTTGGGWCFPVGVQRGVKITGSWGWAETPADVAEAVLLEAAHQLQQVKSPNAVVASADLGSFMVEPAFMPKTMKLLAPYRRVGVRAVRRG